MFSLLLKCFLVAGGLYVFFCSSYMFLCGFMWLLRVFGGFYVVLVCFFVGFLCLMCFLLVPFGGCLRFY